MSICKLLGISVKQCMQNDFVYSEFGRYSFQNIRYYNVVKYFIKILRCYQIKYVKIVYNVLYNDCLNHQKQIILGYTPSRFVKQPWLYEVWIQQTVGDENSYSPWLNKGCQIILCRFGIQDLLTLPEHYFIETLLLVLRLSWIL